MPLELNLGTDNLPRIGSKMAHQLSPSRPSKKTKRHINQINLNSLDSDDTSIGGGGGAGGYHNERLTTLYGNMDVGASSDATRTDRNNFPQSKTQLLSMIRNADKRKVKKDNGEGVSQKT